MRIAFPIKEDNGLESLVNEHFGVSAYFLIVDLDTKDFQVVQNQKQADTRDLLVLDIRQIEAARLDQTGRAEYRLIFVVTVITMKDSEFPMPHTDTAQAQDQLVPLE